MIDYSDRGIISKQVLKNDVGNITLFSFDKGQGLSEHTTSFDTLVQILEGEVEIIINKKPLLLKTGESVIMPANIAHALNAITRFKMLLVMIKRQFIFLIISKI